jgi:hypothetical protein
MYPCSSSISDFQIGNPLESAKSPAPSDRRASQTAASRFLRWAAAQLDKNCCAIFWTRTVLTESPHRRNLLKRGLIVWETLRSEGSSHLRQTPGRQSESTSSWLDVSASDGREAAATIRPLLKLALVDGGFLRAEPAPLYGCCLSPNFSRSEKWSSCAAARRPSLLGGVWIPLHPNRPALRSHSQRVQEL